MNRVLRILNLEDDPNDTALIEHELRKSGLHFELKRIDSAEQFSAGLTDFAPDLVLADYRLPTFDGLAALKTLEKVALAVPFIFVTGALGEERAVEMLKRGATDYVLKDRLYKLTPAILRALAEKEAAEEKRASERQLEDYRQHLEEMVRNRTRQLEAAKIEAEEANRAKNDFLATMSHELRTPLNIILGSTDLLLEQARGDSEERKKHLRNIDENGRHLLNLLNDILEFTHMEPADNAAVESPIDLAAFFETTLAPVRRQVGEKGLSLRLQLDEASGPFAVDPHRLRRVLTNLLDNAVKFTPPGGTVTVAGTAGDSELEVSVSDTGIGIPSVLHERVFEAFFQADGSFSRQYGGTGLGLAIVRRLVGQMGGRITLESAPRQGATFRCRFPAATVAAAGCAPGNANFDTEKDGRHRVLLVEDTSVNLEVAAAMLEELGCSVSTASSGEEAIELLKRNTYELVFMDCRMPGMDGLETTRRLHALFESRPGQPRPPVIAVTAQAFAEDCKRCLEAGMDDYLSKPFNRDQLTQMLAKWLQGQDPESTGANRDRPAAAPSAGDRTEPTRTGADDSPLDLGALEQIRSLRDGDGDQLVNRIIDLFLRDAPDLADSMLEAAARNDVEDLERSAHSLKSSSANIGGVRLSQSCRELERAARERRLDEGKELLQSIRAELPRVMQALSEIRGGDHDA